MYGPCNSMACGVTVLWLEVGLSKKKGKRLIKFGLVLPLTPGLNLCPSSSMVLPRIFAQYLKCDGLV